MSEQSKYEVTELTTREAFDAEASAWDALHRESDSPIPFLRHDWLRAWWDHFGGARRFSILVARRGAEIDAALPLVRDQHRFGVIPLRSLESPTNDHSFRFAPLRRADRPEALEAIWDHLRTTDGSWDLLLLRDVAVPEGEEEGVPFAALATRDGYPLGVWRSYASPYLRLDGTWDSFHEALPGKFRYNLRNRAKRLAAEGATSFSMLANDEVTEPLLDGCFEVERRSWKGEEGSAIACDSTLLSFYRRVARDAAARGSLRLGLLRVGERIAAFDLSLHEGSRFYCLKISYDPEFSRFGAGQLLNARVLEVCFGAGVKEYEFLGPVTEAKEAWQPSTRRHVWVHVFGKGPLARAAHAYKFVLRETLKRKLSE